MARPHQHSVEFIGSPQTGNYSHFQQLPTVQTVMPPVSPPHFNGGPLPILHQPPSLPSVTPSNFSGPVPPTHPTRLTDVSLPPSNFTSINNGNYHLTNMTILSPPSISWITHTQSPPLHPFPPPTTPLTHIHHVQPPPPRLSHSPVVHPQGYSYHDSVYMQMRAYSPQQAPYNLHHSAQELYRHHTPELLMQLQHRAGPPSHQLMSPPPAYHHQEHLPPPPPPPPPPPTAPGHQIHGSAPPQPILPVIRDGWLRSPPPAQQHQHFYPLPSALDHIPTMPQPISPPQIQMQCLPQTPTRPPPCKMKKIVVNGQTFSQQVGSQVSQVCNQLSPTTTSIQVVRQSLQQAISIPTVVKPTPVFATKPPTELFPTMISKSDLDTSSSVGQPVSAMSQHQLMNGVSPAMTTSLKTPSVLTTSPQGSARSDTVVEQTQPLGVSMSSHETKEVEEYNEFATIFRNHRMKLGYTHADVIQQVGIRYGYSFSTDTIAQFEVVQLPLGSVRALKPILQIWLKDTAKAAGTSEEEMKEIIIHASTSINPKRERKRRTNVDSVIKGQLEEEFRKKRTPSQSEMQSMANRFGMEKEFIRVWFCNRRQRQKKLEKELLKSRAKRTSISSPKATIPSPSHDITVVVPSINPRDAGSPIHEDFKFRRTN